MTDLYLALDCSTLSQSLQTLNLLKDYIDGIKIGPELLYAIGAKAVKDIKDRYNISVFLDLKLHDNPDIVSQAIKSLSFCRADFISVHAAGGRSMMMESVKAAGETKILAVTALTSDKTPAYLQPDYAKDAVESGVYGLICPPNSVRDIRNRFGKAVVVCISGIRYSKGETFYESSNEDRDDHTMTVSPNSSIISQVDMIMVGRAITKSENPIIMAKRIKNDLVVSKLYGEKNEL